MNISVFISLQISLQATLLGGQGKYAWLHSQLFRSSKSEEKQPDTKFKLLVYFERSGTDLDQQRDRESEKTKKCDDELEAGDTLGEDEFDFGIIREEDREEKIIIEEERARELELTRATGSQSATADLGGKSWLVLVFRGENYHSQERLMVWKRRRSPTPTVSRRGRRRSSMRNPGHRRGRRMLRWNRRGRRKKNP